MTKKVLLIGRTGFVLDEVDRLLQMPDVQFFAGTGIEDVRSAFAKGNIDHVIMGAGIDLDTRLEMIREIFRLSDRATIHMKDRTTGPQGMLPFVSAVLSGFQNW